MRKINMNSKTKIIFGVLIVGLALIAGWQTLNNPQISEKGVLSPADKPCKIVEISTGCGDYFSACGLTEERQRKMCNIQIENVDLYYNFEFEYLDASCRTCEGLGDALLCKFKVCWKENLIDVSTDKKSYKTGETVYLELKNHYTFTTYVFDRDDIGIIKYNEDIGTWEIFPSYWMCGSPNCNKNCEQKRKFPEIYHFSEKYNNSRVFVWDQRIKDCSNPQITPYQTPRGKYMVWINISVKGEKFMIYSNEFAIE